MLVLVLFAGLSHAQVQRTYTVKAGDTLYRIAINHNMTVGQLQRLNGIDGAKIRVGQMLRLTDGSGERAAVPTDLGADVVPNSTRGADSSSVAAPVPSQSPVGAASTPDQPTSNESQSDVPGSDPTPVGPSVISAVTDSSGAILYGEYAAGEGESLYDLAFGLGLPLDTLLLLNPEYADILADGDPVRVPGAFATTSYSIKPGDSLSRIAAAHELSLSELKAANPGTGNVIRIGRTLQIPSADRPTEVHLPLVVAQGLASVYPDRFIGRLMASGAEYDASRFLLAHPTLPFGTIVLIENPDSGHATFAQVADRMPVTTEYVVEVSAAVADALELGDGPVDIRIIQSGPQH